MASHLWSPDTWAQALAQTRVLCILLSTSLLHLSCMSSGPRDIALCTQGETETQRMWLLYLGQPANQGITRFRTLIFDFKIAGIVAAT